MVQWAPYELLIEHTPTLNIQIHLILYTLIPLCVLHQMLFEDVEEDELSIGFLPSATGGKLHYMSVHIAIVTLTMCIRTGWVGRTHTNYI